MNGWDEFLAWVNEARTRMEDRWAPVGLICLQATECPHGGVELQLEKDAAILWPKDFPIPERGPLLVRMAKPYRDGTVLRS